MTGIIFSAATDFNNWNNSVTIAMISQNQIMKIWCEPIINTGGTAWFGTTDSVGIRRTIIEQFLSGYTETEILTTDSNWFDQSKKII